MKTLAIALLFSLSGCAATFDLPTKYGHFRATAGQDEILFGYSK